MGTTYLHAVASLDGYIADEREGSGKATADSDIVEARFVEIVPNVRVVQAVDFVSDDPAFAGTMTMTWTVGGDRRDSSGDPSC